MRFIWLLVGVWLGLSGLSPALAAELRSSTEGGGITISEREVAKDLHVAGESVAVNASISGDLVAAGGSVVITGDVEDSAFAAGGTISTRGTVGRHLRLAGSEVTVSSVVNGDAFIASGQVVIAEQAIINGDLFIAGGEVTINGTVKGRVFAAGGIVVVNGSVGSVKARVDRLSLGEKAVINGELTYWATRPADVNQAAVVSGQTDYHKVTRYGSGQLAAFTTVSGLFIMLGTFLLLLLAIRFRGQTIRALLNRATSSPLPMTGYGALTLFIAPVVFTLLAITLVGSPLAILGGFLWLTALAAGSLLGKLLLGSWLVKTLTKTSDYPLNWQAAAAGVAASGLLMALPLLGTLVVFIVFLIGLGAVTAALVRRENG